MNNKTEIIAFFSAEHFFKCRTAETRKAKFEALNPEYLKEFGEELQDDIFDFLQSYDAERVAVKKQKEKERITRLQSLPIASGMDKATDHIKSLPPGKYVLSAAQNNTHINKIMLECILTFCKYNDAKLLIGRLTYNKNAFCQPDINNDKDLWYDKDIKPYLVNGHIDLQGVHFLADSNVIPTAKNPLSGFDGATDAGIHIVIPHTKIALEVVAALKNSPTKIIASTGAITKINYIMRKAGAVAAIEHNIGALFVDTTDKDNIIIRQLELMPDCDYFYDYNTMYCSNGSVCQTDAGDITAMQPGDIHAEKMTQENEQKILELIYALEPKALVLHDLLDFSSRNHHNIKDCTFLHEQAIHENTVEGDLLQMARIIDTFADSVPELYVIESNHDLALMTWLKNADFKQDPVNGITYLKCMLALYEHQKEHKNSNFNMLKFAYTNICRGNAGNVTFNGVDESLIMAGVEMGCHGHNGSNGSKGSPTQFRKLGIAMNTGHTHSPSIHGKVYTAGVSASLEMGYNVGASSWMIAHIVTYKNGQRQIIFSK